MRVIVINFIEHPHTGYPLRTRDNAMQTDGTICFAVNFKSSGCLLTFKCCVGASKPFIRIDLNEYEVMTDKQAMDIAADLMDAGIYHLNIAGNSMPNLRHRYTQQGIDAKVADCMDKISKYWPVKEVRTGGQSGVDLAGAIWADSRGIPTTVLAPKGWMYRDENGKDVYSEYWFIKRFGEQYDMGDFL